LPGLGIKKFWGWREKYHLGDLVANGRMILKWIVKEIGCEGADMINVAHGKDR
jgi:hypothetical protein